ncbi:DUF5050 domain-containing protein [Paenibacillus agricola]|uniref:DUF5050 domain-containing protein n=1 Tax=Paenibacillus agricola TaxID=2716264 RepID=A0ABX0JFA5_9BACL|nr:DUF5050 domain-containing protein [Paenibacillus agricola]NHN33373.1 DUF5050 domain-containing protein [Paenibacillus agricola]
MRNKMFLLIGLCTIGLSLMVSPKESFAAEQSIRVTLPDFVVTLNGNRVENQYREYPLLVYKDITYIPMTWYDCRLLGLETEITPNDSLSIAKGRVTSSYVPYQTHIKNLKSNKAIIPTFETLINGERVDNSKEEYPLISFKDVIYFPLTWKFAHDEFEWEYVWNNSEGLAINSNNPQLKTVDLPAFAGENDVAGFEGYYYYTETVGNHNQIYRVPDNNLSNKERVYDYDLDSSYGFNKHLNFEIRANELWFSYHVGGATMGSDVYGKVNDNGIATIEQRGYLDFKSAPSGTLRIDQGVPPGGNNLLWVPTGQDAKKGTSVGIPSLIYGWHIRDDGRGRGFSGDLSTTIVGDDIYVLASSYPTETGDLNKIYKINVTTNETEKIVNDEVSNFKIKNDKLYYVKDADHFLYSSNKDGTAEQQLSDGIVANWYDEIDGHVYYTVANTKGLLNLYKADPAKEDTLVFKEPLESVQLVNDKIIGKLAAGEDYGVKILDKSGNLYVAITDQASDVFAYNDLILIVSTVDKSIKVVK